MAAEQHKDTHIVDYPQQDKATAVDSVRSPQLNKVLCRCRCGCTCASSRGNGKNGTEGGGHCCVHGHKHAMSDTASDDGDVDSVDGEEGAEKQVEVGDLGWMSLRTIRIILRKYGGCLCRFERFGYVTEDEEFPLTGYNSPENSGYLDGSGFLSGGDDSMIVETGNSSRSMSTLSLALSTRSESSGRRSSGDVLPFMGGAFEAQAAQPFLHHFTRAPIFLTAERGFCMNMEIDGQYDGPYPDELDI